MTIISVRNMDDLLLQGKEELLTSIPFSRPQDAGPSVAIVAKVNRIQDQLVKKHDVELHMHLNRLEIAPQIYGMSVSPATVQRCCQTLLFMQTVAAPLLSLLQPVGASAVRPGVSAAGPAGGVGRSFCRQHHSRPGGLHLRGHAALHPRRLYVPFVTEKIE